MRLRILLLAGSKPVHDREVILTEGELVEQGAPLRHVAIPARPIAKGSTQALERRLFSLECWIERRSA